MAEYRYSSTIGLRRCISSMKSTSPGLRFVSRPARSPGLSSTGPEVTLSCAPISCAMMLARVVLPRPGGPCSSTWSSDSPRMSAALMKTFRLSTILSCPENASRSCGRMRFSNSRSLSMFRMFLSVPMMPFAVGCPSVADYGCRRFPRWTGTNIVKAEGKDKSKTQFSDLTLPRRLLYSGNIVKAESKGGSGRSFRSWLCRGACCILGILCKSSVKADRDPVFGVGHAEPPAVCVRIHLLP